MQEVAEAALSQTQPVPRGHVIVSDPSIPCCFDCGVGVLIGDNREFVAKRNTSHPEVEGWFVMPFAIHNPSIYLEARSVARTESCLSSVMTMIEFGALGLRGYGDLNKAKAFEVRIDNAISAMAKYLVVFMLTT